MGPADAAAAAAAGRRWSTATPREGLLGRLRGAAGRLVAQPPMVLPCLYGPCASRGSTRSRSCSTTCGRERRLEGEWIHHRLHVVRVECIIALWIPRTSRSGSPAILKTSRP